MIKGKGWLTDRGFGLWESRFSISGVSVYFQGLISKLVVGFAGVVWGLLGRAGVRAVAPFGGWGCFKRVASGCSFLCI